MILTKWTRQWAHQMKSSVVREPEKNKYPVKMSNQRAAGGKFWRGLSWGFHEWQFMANHAGRYNKACGRTKRTAENG